MNYLITGITGFNGPHLAKKLLEEGHTVYGMHRCQNGEEQAIRDILGDAINLVKFIRCDLLDETVINAIFQYNHLDGVFHLGAYTHPSDSFNHPDIVFKTNTLSTIAICEAIRQHQPNCVLMFCSTAEVYGILTEKDLITEKYPLNPISPYAVSKAAAELYVTERAKNNMIKAYITRAFSHTGPRRRANYCISSDAIQIARIIKNKQEPIIKVGNLAAKRAVIDVKDVINAYYELMLKMQNNEMPNGEIYNISGETPHEIRYYLDIMLNHYNLQNTKLEVNPKLLRAVDIPVQYPDSSKIRSYLNWKPTINIETTLTSLVEYWLQYEDK